MTKRRLYILKFSIIKLSSYLLRSKTLLSLGLSNNRIAGDGAFAISLIIKENTFLKAINLAMNRIDDLNAARILKALARNIFIEDLDLSTNLLSEMSSVGLKHSLKTNTSLISLDVSNSRFQVDDDLVTLLESPSNSLIKLDLRNTSVNEKRIKAINEMLVRKEIKQNRYKANNK